MKIGVYQFEKKQGAQLESMLKAKGYDVIVHKEKLHQETPHPELDVLCIFAGCQVSASILQKFPNVKLVVTGSTGYDHIDIEYCKKQGITVCNVPAYGSDTVAEHAMALLLSLTRRIPEFVQKGTNGDYCLEGMEGTDLAKKTIGVIGTGRIGCNMIQMAKGFDMNVLAFDLYPNQDRAQTMGFEYVDFGTLLKNSDVVSFHVPATPETHHLLNTKNINQLKPGAYIINTARGEVIENNALQELLEKDSISGLGLDVIEDELLVLSGTPTDQQQYILNHPKTIFTPHSGFCTKEAKQRILDTIVANIQAFESDSPQNQL